MRNAQKTETELAQELQAANQHIAGLERAVEVLQDANEKHTRIFNNFPVALSITRMRDGVVIEINDSYTRLTGFTSQEIIGRKVTDFNLWVKPEDRENLLKILQEKDRVRDEELRLRVKSGEVHTVLFSADHINIAGEDCLLAMTIDISRRKKSEEAMRFSDTAFKSIHESVIAVDNENTITYWNSISEQVFGVKASEAVGKNLFNIIKIAPKDYAKIAPLKQKLVDRGYNRDEVLFITPHGEVWVDTAVQVIEKDGKRYGNVMTAQDITSRKQTEKALHESEEKFSKAFSSSANAMCITSLPDNRFVEVNESYSRFTGYTREEVIGRTAAELKLWVYDEELQRLLVILTNEGRFYNREFHSRMKSGEIRVGLGSAEVINIGGKPHRIVAITDITDFKHAEEKLKESEEFTSTLLTNTPDAIFVTYPDGAIKYVNPAFEKLTGFSLADIIGMKTPYPWWPRNTKDEIEATLKETTPGEGIHLGEQLFKQMTFQKKDGGLFTVELNATIINKDDKRQYILVTWIDITERKKAEEALHRSEENFRSTLEDSPFGILIVNSNDETIYANRALLEIYGYYSLEEFRSLPVQARYTPQSYAEYLIRKDKRHRGEEKPVPAGISIIRKDGKIRFLETMRKEVLWNGERQYQIIYQDITQRKKAEEALKDSEEKFSRAFSASANAICITSLEENRFIEINEGFTRFTGYAHEEVIGRSAADLKLWVNPEEQKRWIDTIQKDGRAFNQEFSSHMKSGEIRVGLASAEVINIGGQACRIVAITDITERKKAEEETRTAMSELEESSARLAASNKELEAFSYSVSHDLRSPLRSIDGFSQALLEDYTDKLDATGQDYLKRLRSASQKMGELIDGLLKLSRLTRSEIRREHIDLSTLADEIATRLRETNPERKAEFTIGKGLTTEGDPQMLRALMENLLGNAWKFTGKVPLAKIDFGVVPGSAPRQFFVKDNGAGFDMTYVDKLFGAFQRLHDTTDYPGTGIGLATVRRIINRHGGTVRAEGAVGKGAAFYFTLG